jgi:hypothetical protein
MKKRYLRAPIQHTLVIVEGLLFLFLAGINDYEIEFLPVYLTLVAIMFGLGLFLKKYAKWERYMGDEYEM